MPSGTVLRSLEFMPAVAQVAIERNEEGCHFRVGLNVSVTLYSGAFLCIMARLRGDFVSKPCRAPGNAEFCRSFSYSVEVASEGTVCAYFDSSHILSHSSA